MLICRTLEGNYFFFNTLIFCLFHFLFNNFWGSFVYFLCLLGVLLQNVAFNQTAVQSSLLHNGTADKAVDGNRDHTYEHGSCTHTNNESKPWWRVELQDVYKITAVLITNRGKCAHRLDGAEVWIGLSLESNGAKNFRCQSLTLSSKKNLPNQDELFIFSTHSLPSLVFSYRCGVITHLPEGRTLYISCSGMEARYVTVLLPEKEFLTLCEVEVYSLENGKETYGMLYTSFGLLKIYQTASVFPFYKSSLNYCNSSNVSA